MRNANFLFYFLLSPVVMLASNVSELQQRKRLMPKQNVYFAKEKDAKTIDDIPVRDRKWKKLITEKIMDKIF